MVSRECLILNLILHPINTIIRIEGHFNPPRASARDSYLKILWKYSTTTLLIALLTNKNWTLIDEGNLNLSYPSGQLNIIWRRYQKILRGVFVCKDMDSKVELYFHDPQNRRACCLATLATKCQLAPRDLGHWVTRGSGQGKLLWMSLMTTWTPGTGAFTVRDNGDERNSARGWQMLGLIAVPSF